MEAADVGRREGPTRVEGELHSELFGAQRVLRATPVRVDPNFERRPPVRYDAEHRRELVRKDPSAGIVSDARDCRGKARSLRVGSVRIGEVIEVDTEPTSAKERSGNGERAGELRVMSRLRSDLLVSRFGDRTEDGRRKAEFHRRNVAVVEPVIGSHRDRRVDFGMCEVVRRIRLVEHAKQFPPLTEPNDDRVGINPGA